MCDISSVPSSGTVSHKEKMALIKQDLQQFSHDRNNETEETRTHKKPDGSRTPCPSSRWTQFVCGEESESEESGEGISCSGLEFTTMSLP